MGAGIRDLQRTELRLPALFGMVTPDRWDVERHICQIPFSVQLSFRSFLPVRKRWDNNSAMRGVPDPMERVPRYSKSVATIKRPKFGSFRVGLARVKNDPIVSVRQLIRLTKLAVCSKVWALGA